MALTSFEASDTESQDVRLMDATSPSGRRRRVALATVVGLGIGVLVGLATTAVLDMRRQAVAPMVPIWDTPEQMDTFEQKESIAVVPSRPACSKPKENCLPTMCCLTSGHTCFETMPGKGICNETCTRAHGYSCKPFTRDPLPAVYHSGTSMYCFAVYTNNTGSPKKSYELELLQQQHKMNVGIYLCEGWDIFSDVHAVVAPGIYDTIQVFDEYGEFHFAKRKETHTWVNWGLFFQVWKQVRALGRWNLRDYTVKVDADAVFIPGRLKSWLGSRSVTQRGVYYENCAGVDSGFFGNIEVLSHDAAAVYTSLLEDCHYTFSACAKTGCDWKYGPWGEDVFAQRCMDRGLVSKVEAFDLTTDAACPHDRPAGQKKNKKWVPDCAQTCTPAIHHFKKPKDWFKCLDATLKSC